MRNRFIIFKKISAKLTLVYALIFSLVLIILNASVLYGVKYFLVNQSFRQVDDVSKSITNKIEGIKDKNINLSDRDLIADIQPEENMYAEIIDSQGEIINKSPRWNINFPIKSISGHTIKIEKKDKELVCRNNTIKINNGETIQLLVVRDMEHEYNFMELLFAMMVISDIIGIVVSLVSGMFVSKRMLKPIDNITKTAQSISIRDLNKRIEVNTADDELSRLAKTFNEMIQRLQDSFESQNKFVSDASHELRTPISVIQGYINLLDRWGKDDKEVLQKAINFIKNETSNMTNLIEKLLFLARGDNNSIKLEKENFRLELLIEEVVKESKIITTSHHIQSEKNDAVMIHADPRLVKQVMRAIIDNSIKYTHDNGKIKINSSKALNGVEITIEDTGIGIPEDELPNLFNRFYRVDKARSKKTGGTGLGLAIAKQIIDLHHGSIFIESKPEIGTKVIIKLPLE